MTPAAIAAQLVPYMERSTARTSLPEALLLQLSAYLEILLRWNARTNLTAIRSPEEIVTRHFGESLFAAQKLFPDDSGAGKSTLADVGSGAGFPGLPMKLWTSQFMTQPLHVTLIESQQKKATFLREVIRALDLTDIEVQPTRAEQVSKAFDIVTLRAVEHFDQILPTAANLVRLAGRLALLIGQDQIAIAQTLLPTFQWDKPHAIPNSNSRVLLIGTPSQESS